VRYVFHIYCIYGEREREREKEGEAVKLTTPRQHAPPGGTCGAFTTPTPPPPSLVHKCMCPPPPCCTPASSFPTKPAFSVTRAAEPEVANYQTDVNVCVTILRGAQLPHRCFVFFLLSLLALCVCVCGFLPSILSAQGPLEDGPVPPPHRPEKKKKNTREKKKRKKKKNTTPPPSHTS